MAEPPCARCKFFHPDHWSGGKGGECTDPSKIIFNRRGAPERDGPHVQDGEEMTCTNWTAAED